MNRSVPVAVLCAIASCLASARGTVTDSLPPDFPPITVTVNENPAPGQLLMSPIFRGTPRYSYLTILDRQIAPQFMLRHDGSLSDFRLQPNGLLTFFNASASAYYAMDATYAIVDSFRCGNGYTTDGHDMRLLPNGHALLMAYDTRVVDMRLIVPGGDSAAAVIGTIIQEIDEQKRIVFEWKSWDHFQITDAAHLDFAFRRIDYVHANALDVDIDGNILLSCRHMDEITKISRTTGEIIWRLGGKHNQFTFVNDTVRFCYQHDCRRLLNGNITVFDNGNYRTPAFSRGVEYRLDERMMTAELVWEYRHTPSIAAQATGNVQRLSNGNTLISWGTENAITEVRPDGTTALELTLSPLFTTYRTLRSTWPVVSVRERPLIPEEVSLTPLFPNPFNGSASVYVDLFKGSVITLALYNILGQRVRVLREGWQDAGRSPYVLEAGDLASGVYFLRLTTGPKSVTERVMLVR